jgi:hypothetical protein
MEGVRQYVLSRCAVCGCLEAVEPSRRDEHFVDARAGIWVHLGDCLAQWTAADDAQRTEWGVQAIRWRDAS